MQVELPYGRGTVTATVPDTIGVDVIDLPDVRPSADPLGEVGDALTSPLGGFDWRRWERAGSVAIAVNDKTRPVPHRHLLPPLLAHLAALGIADDAITLHIAVGGHPPMTPDEFTAVLPADIVDRYRVVSHDAHAPDGLVALGATSRGTPVWASRAYVDTDFKIVVGTIEPHQFVGFSGGVKSAAIGLAGPATIDANHTLMAHPDAVIGTYATNPARQDVEQIGQRIGVDLALNAILDPHREIVCALAGDPVAVMEAGWPLAVQHSLVEVEHAASLVIASPGGHPKDINVYQSQKAVSSAARIVRPGGTIVLTAACPEGAGSEHYEDWVAQRSSPEDVLATFRAEGFRVGPHKAFQLARDSAEARLIVCSEMPDELCDRLLLEHCADLQDAVDQALAGFAPTDRVAVLPHAGLTIPTLRSSNRT